MNPTIATEHWIIAEKWNWWHRLCYYLNTAWRSAIIIRLYSPVTSPSQPGWHRIFSIPCRLTISLKLKNCTLFLSSFTFRPFSSLCNCIREEADFVTATLRHLSSHSFIHSLCGQTDQETSTIFEWWFVLLGHGSLCGFSTKHTKRDSYVLLPPNSVLITSDKHFVNSPSTHQWINRRWGRRNRVNRLRF